jgi:hypothetical protein
MARGDAAYGMTKLAGISVGASFVGAAAGALAVADLLGVLENGPAHSVISLDLRNPLALDAVSNAAPGSPQNLGFTLARD